MAYGSAPYGSTTYGQQAVILPTIVGSMNQTLAGVTFTSATASNQVSGSLTKTLEAVTGTSLVLVNAVAAVLTKTLVDIAVTSGSGAVALAATLTKTFVDLIRTLQLQGSIDSALSKTLAFLGLSADGIAYARTGNLVALLADVLSTAMQGAGAISGTLTKTLNTFLGSNLIQNSKFAGTTGLPYGWSAYISTPTITYGETDPNGGKDAISFAFKAAATTGLLQNTAGSFPARGQKVSSGIWMRADAPTSVRFGPGDQGPSLDQNVTTSWQLFTNLDKSLHASEGRVTQFYTMPGTNPGLADGSKVYVAFPQVNFGPTLMAYEDSNSIGRAFISLVGNLTKWLTNGVRTSYVDSDLRASLVGYSLGGCVFSTGLIAGSAPDGGGTVRQLTVTTAGNGIRFGIASGGSDNAWYAAGLWVRTRDGSTKFIGTDVADHHNTNFSVDGNWQRIENYGKPFTGMPWKFFDVGFPVGDFEVFGLSFQDGVKITEWGTGNRAADGLSMVLTSTVALVGTLSKTLSILLDTLAATAGVSGTLSKTLAALGRTITGGVSLAGTLNKALGKMVLTSGTVTGSIVGTLSKTLGKLTVASSWVKAARRRIMMMTRSRRPKGVGGGLPALPPGYAFLVTAAGGYIVTSDGSYIIVEA